jgi:branched-chain amino acid transport system ATP-binding protein
MVICLDEPTAGLDPVESEQLGHRLRAMIDGGLTGLLVDHDMALVLGVCDFIYVLEFGRIIAQGTPQQIRADDRVIAAYLPTSGSSEDVDEPTA